MNRETEWRLRGIRKELRKLEQEACERSEALDEKVQGKCDQNDSCLQCREARMADEDYMANVYESQKLFGLRQLMATNSDLESRMDLPIPQSFYEKWIEEAEKRLESLKGGLKTQD